MQALRRQRIDVSSRIPGDVLLVEDDDDIREVMREVLALEGYRVTTAHNGREAMDLLTHFGAPCVIVLDLLMPVMNGWEVLAALRRDPALAKVPVIVVSADGHDLAGFEDVTLIAKPVAVEQLLASLRKYCHCREALAASPAAATTAPRR